MPGFCAKCTTPNPKPFFHVVTKTLMISRTRPLFWPPTGSLKPARPRFCGQSRFSGLQADKAAFLACKAMISRTRPVSRRSELVRGQGRFFGLRGQDFVDKASFHASKAWISRTRPLARRPAGFHGQGRFSGLQDFTDLAGFQASRATISWTRPALKPSGKAGFYVVWRRLRNVRRHLK